MPTAPRFESALMMSAAAARGKQQPRRAATPKPAIPAGGCLPARQHRTLELGQDELLHLRRVIAVDQQLDPGLVLVGGANRDQIDIGALRVLAQDRVLDRI